MRREKRVFSGVPKRARVNHWFSREVFGKRSQRVIKRIGKRVGRPVRLGVRLAARVWQERFRAGGYAWRTIRSVKHGSRVSRALRYIFELKFIKTVIGTAVVVVFLLSVLAKDVGGAFGFEKSWDTHKAEQVLVAADGQSIIETERGVQSPLASSELNQGFWFGHKGLDLRGQIGDEVRPVASGVVENVEHWRYAYGNHVIINHGSGFKTLYAHLSRVSVEPGDEVTKDSVIGLVGTTGWSTGPHLHLEFRIDDEAVNPAGYLQI